MLYGRSGFVAYVTPLLLAVLAGCLIAAWKRGRLAVAFGLLTIVLGIVWGLALAAIWTDYRDADGFVDCWPSCSRFQDGVEWAFWFTPVLFVVLAFLAGVLGVISVRRGRRAQKRTDKVGT